MRIQIYMRVWVCRHICMCIYTHAHTCMLSCTHTRAAEPLLQMRRFLSNVSVKVEYEPYTRLPWP